VSPPSFRGRRALLPLLPAPSVVAMLGSRVVATAPVPTAARPAAAPAFAATNSTTVVSTEVPAFPTAATPLGRDGDGFALGTSRCEEAKRGGRNGSPSQLYCLTPRDRAGVQAHRQVVEGANTSFISPGQQRISPFPSTLNVTIRAKY
jgi:hypothetical protein